MSALSSIADYGTSTDESDCECENNKSEKLKIKLKVPNLTRVPVVSTDIHLDNPQKHNGRIRAFPHVRGNWASFVYIKYPKEDTLQNLVLKIERESLACLQTDGYRSDEYHISLSKTVVLQYHLITTFTQSLQEIFCDLECFDLEFSSVKIYCNETKTRTFIALEVDYFTRKCLLKLSSKVDQVLEDFKLPLFYENPSFHVSILWFNGDKKSELSKQLEKFNALLLEETENSLRPVSVDTLHCKIAYAMANKNKVYVNPNFNRIHPTRDPMALAQNKIIMHVNPNFSQVLSNRNKIYVNPNFVNTEVHIRPNDTNSNLDSVNNKVVLTNQLNIPLVGTKPDEASMEQSTSRTRYTLVRQNTSKVARNNPFVIATNTIKINKYKSVSIKNFTNNVEHSERIPLTDKITTTVKIDKFKTVALSKFRKNLEVPKGLSNMTLKNPPVTYKSTAYSVQNTSHPEKCYDNKYRFSKPNPSVRFHKEAKPPNRFSFDKKYRNIKLKMTKKRLKKNNIPCPLYRKYGKCLRSIIGTCEFLHDKKHVSICRKFLKGLCRDEACILSHDVSTKKMPTCYFYLKGICTKTDCPYLHVKLNEKSKVCQDFLKGYCEKGDMCLNRHIHVNSHKQSKSPTNHTICSKTIRKQSNSCHFKNTSKDVDLKALKKDEHDQKQNSGETTKSENRYYFNKVMTKSEDSETNEVIKPTRCKLGTLPSYIKF